MFELQAKIIELQTTISLYNKRVHPAKNEPRQQGISYLERETEGEIERGRRQVNRQAYLRLG
jgi:hypothetical protein